MTWYDMHRLVYDFVRSNESGHSESFAASGYELSTEERAAFDARDIAALYGLGLHPVLLNRYCREIGYSRDDYRAMLSPFTEHVERMGRWQN